MRQKSFVLGSKGETWTRFCFNGLETPTSAWLIGPKCSTVSPWSLWKCETGVDLELILTAECWWGDEIPSGWFSVIKPLMILYVVYINNLCKVAPDLMETRLKQMKGVFLLQRSGQPPWCLIVSPWLHCKTELKSLLTQKILIIQTPSLQRLGFIQTNNQWAVNSLG